MKLLHKTNIFFHVIAGSAALICGLVALVTIKGVLFHKRFGKAFLILLSIVIVTGFFGVFVFQRNTFLVVITALSGYSGFSGYRILQTKNNKPYKLDILVSLLTLWIVSYFLYYLDSIGMIWNPVVIYGIVGATFVIITYDFLRYWIPSKHYKNMWLYEHIYKMTAAYTAILSAFSGTVFEKYQPYSQILPSVFGTFVMLGFVIYTYKKNSSKITENK